MSNGEQQELEEDRQGSPESLHREELTTKRGESKGEVAEEASWDPGIQSDKTERNERARSVKESEMRCQSICAVARYSLNSLLISQHATLTARHAETLGERKDSWLLSRSLADIVLNQKYYIVWNLFEQAF